MGFNMLFYIIFGTNLLTGGPVPVSVFIAYCRVLQKRNTKQSPNGMKFRDDLSWTRSKPGDLEMKSKKQRGDHEGGGRTQGGRACPQPCGPLIDLLT